ncbi:MAG TPA: nuclear transport factor 2 family protein [Blastocatellia bacterium]|nr:nuclear transport factor 2 family protein [Blastocatellia bacterium]
MKTISIVILLLLAISSAAAQNKQPANKTEQAILKLEEEWVGALTKADTAALDRIYADGLTYTHSSGAVDTKASYIANLKAGNTKYESLEREDIKVALYGDTAVATCKATIKLVNKSGPTTLVTRVIHVYVRQQGRWQMVAHQTTRIAQ